VRINASVAIIRRSRKGGATVTIVRFISMTRRPPGVKGRTPLSRSAAGVRTEEWIGNRAGDGPFLAEKLALALVPRQLFERVGRAAADGFVVDQLDVRQPHNAPPGRLDAQAQVNVVVIDGEALIEALDLVEDIAAHEQA